MSEKQKAFIVLAIVSLFWLVVGGFCGFFIGRTMYNHPIKESVTRDTVRRIDTIFQFHPQPVEVEKVRTEYKWLTRVQTDTVTNYTTLHDSVLVEVPIESRHYRADDYDAWVSGYKPSLDSIRVYRQKEYITEVKTISKPPNRFSIGLQGGYGYGFKSKQWEPYIGLGIGIKVF